MSSFIEVTVAHHGDQEFYGLGRLELEVPPEVLLQHLPTGSPHDCDTAPWCIILDYWPDPETGISDDREVTTTVADQLLNGRFGVLLDGARSDLADYYRRMGAA